MKTIDKRKGRIIVIDKFIPVELVITKRKNGRLHGHLEGFVEKKHYEYR